MESSLSQLTLLLEEGKQFNFDNFCVNHRLNGQFGGEDAPDWMKWKIRTFNIIHKLFSDKSPANLLAKSGLDIQTPGNGIANFELAKSSLIKAIEVAIEVLESDTYGEIRSPVSSSSSPALSNKVFIVHGHDHALKTELESFLHKIGLDPVVLHRQPDQGQTIIEKFEHHSDVGFAFILLTPDEIAFTVDQIEKPDSQRTTEIRARPNVIFEFGYFVGKLGRQRVCCLYKGGVNLPSDINGIIYKQVDSNIESQAYSMIMELKAAGFEIKI